MSLILAIDQGTTSTRAIAFEVACQAARSAVGEEEGDLRPVAVSQIELAQPAALTPVAQVVADGGGLCVHGPDPSGPRDRAP